MEVPTPAFPGARHDCFFIQFVQSVQCCDMTFVMCAASHSHFQCFELRLLLIEPAVVRLVSKVTRERLVHARRGPVDVVLNHRPEGVGCPITIHPGFCVGSNPAEGWLLWGKEYPGCALGQA